MAEANKTLKIVLPYQFQPIRQISQGTRIERVSPAIGDNDPHNFFITTRITVKAVKLKILVSSSPKIEDRGCTEMSPEFCTKISCFSSAPTMVAPHGDSNSSSSPAQGFYNLTSLLNTRSTISPKTLESICLSS